MFNINNIFKKFKSNKDNQSDEKNILNKDNLIIELTNKYISYKVNHEDKVNVVYLPIQEYKYFDDLLKLWVETLSVIIETIKIKPSITILIKSGNFFIRNHENFLDKDVVNKFFANKLALNEDNIEVKKLTQNSYMIVEYKFLQKLLFAFKDYNITNIYDTSIINSFNIKSEEKCLYIDISLESCNILLNNEKLQKRIVKTDLNFLIDRCAKELYLDYDTSYQTLKLDFKDINKYVDLENSTKPLQKILKDFLDLMMEDIKNTLSYFSIYENIEYIEKIYVNGDVLELDFIINILSDKLDIKLIPLNKYAKINHIEKTNLTLYSSIDESILQKLYIDFEGLHYSDGRDEYVFIENKFISKGQLSTSQKSKISTQKKEIKIDTKESYLHDEFNKPIWKMGMTELYQFIYNKYSNKQKINSSLKVNIKFFYAIAIIPVFITFIYLFNIISDTQIEFTNNINTLENRIIRVDKLKKQLINKNKQLNLDILKKDIDKIFWTQKFITLANLMPNEIWLSSVTMRNSIKKIEDKEVTSQVMVLESRALPSTIGHISSIAVYMDKLLNADYSFAKDFSNISFGGAQILNEYGYDVVNFKLLCNFEKNINVKDIENKVKNVKENSISKNLQNIKNSKIKQDKILNKLQER